eukprot:gene5987-7633_t
MGKSVVVIGAQWGDEGKGKIVDWLSERAEVVVRFQGGHNAGHTLVIGNQTYKLALLPSGARTISVAIASPGVSRRRAKPASGRATIAPSELSVAAGSGGALISAGCSQGSSPVGAAASGARSASTSSS